MWTESHSLIKSETASSKAGLCSKYCKDRTIALGGYLLQQTHTHTYTHMHTEHSINICLIYWFHWAGERSQIKESCFWLSYLFVFRWAHTDTHMHRHTHTYTITHTQLHCTHTHTHTPHTHTTHTPHTHTHARTHAHTHARTHTHTHTHTHSVWCVQVDCFLPLFLVNTDICTARIFSLLLWFNPGPWRTKQNSTGSDLSNNPLLSPAVTVRLRHCHTYYN